MFIYLLSKERGPLSAVRHLHEKFLFTPFLVSQGPTPISYYSSLIFNHPLIPTISYFSSSCCPSYMLNHPRCPPQPSSAAPLVGVPRHTGQHSAAAPVCPGACMSVCLRMAYLYLLLLSFWFLPSLTFRLRDYILWSRFSLAWKRSQVLFLYFTLAESTYLYHTSYTLIFFPLCAKFLFNTLEYELLKGEKSVPFVFIFLVPNAGPGT